MYLFLLSIQHLVAGLVIVKNTVVLVGCATCRNSLNSAAEGNLPLSNEVQLCMYPTSGIPSEKLIGLPSIVSFTLENA